MKALIISGIIMLIIFLIVYGTIQVSKDKLSFCQENGFEGVEEEGLLTIFDEKDKCYMLVNNTMIDRHFDYVDGKYYFLEE